MVIERYLGSRAQNKTQLEPQPFSMAIFYFNEENGYFNIESEDFISQFSRSVDTSLPPKD